MVYYQTLLSMVMGLRKVVGILVLLIVVIAGVLGADLYLTVNTLAESDSSTFVGTPLFQNENNTHIIVTVPVDIPAAGFIPKGARITVIISVEGGENQTSVQTVALGQAQDVFFSFELGITDRTELATGGSVSVRGWATIAPIVLGITLGDLSPGYDLGTVTVNGK